MIPAMLGQEVHGTTLDCGLKLATKLLAVRGPLICRFSIQSHEEHAGGGRIGRTYIALDELLRAGLCSAQYAAHGRDAWYDWAARVGVDENGGAG